MEEKLNEANYPGNVIISSYGEIKRRREKEEGGGGGKREDKVGGVEKTTDI